MLIKRKIILLSCSIFFIGDIFLMFGCEDSPANQPKSFVSKNVSVNKSRNANANAASSYTNLAENISNSQLNSTNNSLADTRFAQAAAQNARLKSNLQWTFGGKTQTGWYLYENLIAHLIETEAKAESSEFAEALARWQKSAGLAPSGILDEPTLNAIVKNWQANRLKNRGYASPDELITAPPTDFYDPMRVEDLRRLEYNTYAAYKKMVAAAIADKSLKLATDEKGNLAATEKFLKIVSVFRSREYQAKLRREAPNSGRAGLAVKNSPHFTGRALDIYVGGEPVETRDDNRAFQVQTPVYKWLVKNAGKFGFKPYFYEPWHWEYAPE